MSKGKSPAKGSDSTANPGFEAKLWLTADKLLNNTDVAEYNRAERDRLPQAARRVGAEVPIVAGFVLTNGSMSSNQSGEKETWLPS